MFLLLISFVPMTIFNDRFLNLNPYPFLLYVVLFLSRKALAAGLQERDARENFGVLALKSKRVRKLSASPGLAGGKFNDV